jgi:hypothetical protein
MKKLFLTLFLAFARPVRTAVNESSAAESEAVFASNEAKKDGDWVQLSPFGDFDNAVGLQRFRKEDAQNVVNEFQSLLNTPARLLGLPWYIGHPDHEPMKQRYKDTKAYGRIKELAVRDDGLYGRVKFSEDGKKLVEAEAFHGHSVNWKMRKDGNTWRPFSLKSVGFTNEPGIPAKPVTAANEKQTDDTYMKRDALIKTLKLDANATDEQIETALTGLQTTSAANEKKVIDITADLTAEKAKATTATTEAANEKKERAKLLVAEGVRLGKLTKADEAGWLTKFESNFAEAANELQAAKPKINTTSKVAGLGQRNSTGVDRSQQIADAVNERMKSKGGDYHTNFIALKKEKPELFAVATA